MWNLKWASLWLRWWIICLQCKRPRFAYVWNRKRIRDIENRLEIAKGDGHAGIEWEVGIGRCKLLDTEWINNKVLLYSRGNSIQYYVINHSESESQSCPTLCKSRDYTVHGILRARKLEWIAVPFSRISSQPRDWTQVSCIAGRFFTSWATREAPINHKGKAHEKLCMHMYNWVILLCSRN